MSYLPVATAAAVAASVKQKIGFPPLRCHPCPVTRNIFIRLGESWHSSRKERRRFLMPVWCVCVVAISIIKDLSDAS